MPFKTKPKRQLKSSLLKDSLKAYLLPHILNHYEIVCVRALLRSENDYEVWTKRRWLERILDNDENIVFFISCITAVLQKKQEKKTKRRKKDLTDKQQIDKDCHSSSDDLNKEDYETISGLSFWIAFDWPGYGVKAYENKIFDMFMKANVDPMECSAIHGRGNLFYIFYRKKINLCNRCEGNKI